jgi:Signal transduction histidine kinase
VRTRYTRTDGETVICEWHNQVVTGADGEVQVVFSKLEDVTEQRENRRELQAQNERLEEFAGIVSHDLRSPLTAAEGHIELAQESCESDSLVRVADAIDRGQRLIDDLLTLVRQNETVTEVERIELGEVAKRCWQTVDTRMATIEIDTTRVIRAGTSRLRQLLENLYRNAVEHGGAKVTVTVGDLPDGFHVTDTGSGIPENARAQVFEADTRPVRAGPGSACESSGRSPTHTGGRLR